MSLTGQTKCNTSINVSGTLQSPWIDTRDTFITLNETGTEREEKNVNYTHDCVTAA